MIRQHLWNLRVRVAAGIASTIEAGPRLTDGSGPPEVVENGPRETLAYEMCLNNYLRTVRTSTRRRPRYWGTTSPGKMICASAFVGAGSRLTIADDRRRTAGSGLPPLAGKGHMLRELETLV